MTKIFKNIALALILSFSFTFGVSNLQAANPGMTKSGHPKGAKKVAIKKNTRISNEVEYLRPGSDFLMEMNSWMRGDLEIQVSDAEGNVIQTAKTRVDSQDNTLKFKVGELNKGVYNIKVLTKARVQKKRIVIN